VNTAPLPPPPTAPERFWNPYVAGVGLGLTLLVAFVSLGTGLGASGALARGAAEVTHAIAPKAVEDNGYLSPWFADGPAVRHYLVFMTLGVLVGGFLSARAARRTRLQIERGPNSTVRRRIVLALVGGVLAGFGARMAGGCTSGQALTGGALLLEGSWAFMMAVFAAGFGAAWFVRKEWL